MEITLATVHVRRSAQAVPLAAGCLAAYLPEPLRCKVQLLDFFADQEVSTVVRTILDGKPELVAFPVYVWNRVQVAAVAREISRQQPAIRLVAGGPEAGGDPERLAAAADWSALVIGEGEELFAQLVEAWSTDDEPKSEIPGVIFPGHPAASTSDPRPPLDLEKLPSPWLSGLLAPTPQGGVVWEVSRGCAFGCDYCYEAAGHQKVRSHSRERLRAELELFTQIGVSQVWVLDATFNYPPQRGVELLELLLETAPQLHYHLEAKVDFVDPQTASLLSRLSCSLQLGLQSTDSKVLSAVHRHLDLDILNEKIHLLEAYGVIYGFDLIFGLPQDSYSGFIRSLDTSLHFSPNHLHIFPLAILPGTRLAQQRDRHGLVAQPAPPYEIIRSPSWSEQDLQRARILAAAVDIFYNTGRAVAFFPALLELFEIEPHHLFEELTDWALKQSDIDQAMFLASDQWNAHDAYRLQQGFLSWRLKQAGLNHLTTAVLDLLCYHFHYAETLLGPELAFANGTEREATDLWTNPWLRSKQLRLVPFAYEILDLQEMDEMSFAEFVELFRPVGSTALFVRRGGEVLCESLSDEMLRLLKESDGSKTPEQIFAGSLDQKTGRELVEFAVAEGLVQKPI